MFTKADKVKPAELRANVDRFLGKLSEQWEELPPHFVTSSEKRTGRMELLDYIEHIVETCSRTNSES